MLTLADNLSPSGEVSANEATMPVKSRLPPGMLILKVASAFVPAIVLNDANVVWLLKVKSSVKSID